MTAATAAALAVAASIWGHPCQVTVRWEPLPAGVLGASDRTACVIVVNRRGALAWRDRRWSKYCSVVIHEYGHLAGARHSTNPRSLMFPEYMRDDPRCTQ